MIRKIKVFQDSYLLPHLWMTTLHRDCCVWKYVSDVNV